jgi:hypothetical protein
VSNSAEASYYEYYIVRVYRRGSDPADPQARLAGVVEDGRGRQWAFQSAEELISLFAKPEDGTHRE